MLLIKILYFFVSAFAYLSRNKAAIRRKIILGGIIAGMMTSFSCKIFKPPHKCYAPVIPENQRCYDTVVAPEDEKQEIVTPPEKEEE